MSGCTNPAHYADIDLPVPAMLDPRLHRSDGTLCVEKVYDEDGITLYRGDCLAVLPYVEADVLISDPDYGVGVNFTKHGYVGDLSKNVGRQARPAREADVLLTAMLRSARIRRNGLVFWSGSWGRVQAFSKSVAAGGWRIHHLGIWYKANGAGPSGNGLARRFEPWFWLEQGPKTTRRGEWKFLPDCIDVSRVVPGHDEACDHPTQKPAELMRRLIRFFTQPGDVILDPFAGSGTTLVAARDTGRRAIGIEREERWCELAVQRLRYGVRGVQRIEAGQLPLGGEG